MTKCGACGKEFSGVTAFDAHRTGTYNPPTRRCLSTHEMLERGFAEETKGSRVKWYQVEKREALLRAYPRKTGTSDEEEDPSLWDEEGERA
jgi:hypothetical protein